MPKIHKQFHLEITVEQFLNACSPLELNELDMLLSSGRYQNKMAGNDESETDKKHYDKIIEIRRALNEL